jgi:hypothetical protein
LSEIVARKKNFKRATWARFCDAAGELGRHPYDLIEEIGYARSVASTWAAENDCPMVAAIAVEALVGQQRLKADLIAGAARAPDDAIEIVVLRLRGAQQLDQVTRFCAGFGISAQHLK